MNKKHALPTGNDRPVVPSPRTEGLGRYFAREHDVIAGLAPAAVPDLGRRAQSGVTDFRVGQGGGSPRRAF